MTPDEDPGWGVSWWLILMVVPGGARYVLRRKGPLGHDGLRTLRAIFLAFVGALVLYGVVLLLIGGGSSTGSATPFAIGLAAYGVATLVLTRVMERPLSCESDAELAGTYRTRFFRRVAFAESVALFGFVAVFTVGAVWLYFLAVVFTAVGFVQLAPTRAHLEADQQQLIQQACGRSLVSALRSTRPGNPL